MSMSTNIANTSNRNKTCPKCDKKFKTNNKTVICNACKHKFHKAKQNPCLKTHNCQQSNSKQEPFNLVQTPGTSGASCPQLFTAQTDSRSNLKVTFLPNPLTVLPQYLSKEAASTTDECPASA